MPEGSKPLDPTLLRVIQALARTEAARDFEAVRRDQERVVTPKRATFTTAEIRRAVSAVEAAGKTVGAVDFPPSGGFRIIIGTPDALQNAPESALDRWRRDKKKKAEIASSADAALERVRARTQASLAKRGRSKSAGPDRC